MEQRYDTVVIGGGAAGITAAIAAAENGEKVLLAESGNRTGRKIAASGNGRCNLMNRGELRYYGDARFAESVFKTCPRAELERFFNRYGLVLTEAEEGRVYPATMNSSTVMGILQRALEMNGVTVQLQTRITEIRKRHEGNFALTAEGKEAVRAGRVIVCTGGRAQKKLGGSDDGYRMLEQMGHHTEKVLPALVPVVTDRESISGLAGIRAKGTVTLKSGDKTLHRETGEILFTEYGVSGICVMQCARFIRPDKCEMEIDLVSGMFPDQREFLEEISRRRVLFAQMPPTALLEGMMMPKLCYATEKQAGIPLRGERCGELSDEDLRRITEAAYHYRVKVKDTRGFEYAQVTSGGARCDEFSPETMESKTVRGLYAAGEVLNVDGDCGGFNLMFAFCSGLIAGGYFRGNAHSGGQGREGSSRLPSEQDV